MDTDGRRSDEWNAGTGHILASVKPQGEDRQLPIVGFRATGPAPTTVEERTVRTSGPPRFLLAGLGLIVPAAAVLVPTPGKQRIERSRGDLGEPFAAGVAPELKAPRRRRAGAPLLLAAGLAGGALFYWLRRGGQRAATIRRAITTIAERVGAFAPSVAAASGDATPTQATRPTHAAVAAPGQPQQPGAPHTEIARVRDAVPDRPDATRRG